MPVGRPFQPGHSGNPSGRPRRRLFDETLRQVLQTKNGHKAKQLVETLLEIALSGGKDSVSAIRLIAERVGGKALSAEAVSQTPEPKLSPEEAQRQFRELLRHPGLKALVQAALGAPEGTVQ